MEKLSIALTDYYIANSQIPYEKRDIYIYGFNLVFSDIINFSIILFLGLLFSLTRESMVFLLTLCTVRRYTGGFHAKSFSLCRILMIVIFAVVMLIVSQLEVQNYLIPIVVIINILNVVGISVLAPIENANKKLSESKKIENKIKSRRAATVFSMSSVLLILFDLETEGVTISITLFAIFVLMVAGVITKKGGNSSVQLDE